MTLSDPERPSAFFSKVDVKNTIFILFMPKFGINDESWHLGQQEMRGRIGSLNIIIERY